MSDFSEGLTKIFGGSLTVDVGKVVTVVEALLEAAPAIEKGIATAEPFIEALVSLIKSGGNPTAQDWIALTAKLDAASAQIAEASSEAQKELDAQAATTTVASASATTVAPPATVTASNVDTSIAGEAAASGGESGGAA